METTLKTIEPPIDPAVVADLGAVCNVEGIVRDPDPDPDPDLYRPAAWTRSAAS